MSRDEIRQTVLHTLWSLAPEAEGQPLAEDADLREELDLDSMDFLNLVTALHEALHVDIPEAVYARVGSLQGMVEYLAHELGAD
jgi:acyl carrier protein